MVSEEDLIAAEEAFRQKRVTVPFAKRAFFDNAQRLIVVEFSSGFSLSFAPERAQGLAGATSENLQEIEISSGGYGLHFPRLDTDFSVEGLREGRFGSDRWESQWALDHQAELMAA